MTKSQLKDFRKKKGWSQWDLAIFLGVSQSYVCIWEKGYKPVPDKVVVKIERN